MSIMLGNREYELLPENLQVNVSGDEFHYTLLNCTYSDFLDNSKNLSLTAEEADKRMYSNEYFFMHMLMPMCLAYLYDYMKKGYYPKHFDELLANTCKMLATSKNYNLRKDLKLHIKSSIRKEKLDNFHEQIQGTKVSQVLNLMKLRD